MGIAFIMSISRLITVITTWFLINFYCLVGIAMGPTPLSETRVEHFSLLIFLIALGWNGAVWFFHLGLLWLSAAPESKTEELPIFKELRERIEEMKRSGEKDIDAKLSDIEKKLLVAPKEIVGICRVHKILRSYTDLETYLGDKETRKRFQDEVRNKVWNLEWQKLKAMVALFTKRRPPAGGPDQNPSSPTDHGGPSAPAGGTDPQPPATPVGEASGAAMAQARRASHQPKKKLGQAPTIRGDSRNKRKSRRK